MALLEVVDVCKEFPGVRALDGVSFTLQPGEVHALVGENGAGKSTLIKVLTGVHHPDRGRLRYRAEPVRFDSPMDAQRAGISAIHQEVNLIPLMSVAHNLFLGREPRTTLGLLDEKRMVREAREVLSRYGVATDVRRQLGTLALGAQQMVALARAVMIDARVVIMDEPTSSLEPREVETLFGVIGDLHAKGIGVVYVSHRLDELYRICDTVTILRDGKVVHTGRLADLERIRLVALMLGRETATVRRQGFTTFATHHSSSRSGTPSPIPGNRQATPSPAGADAGRTRADANPAPRHTGATDDEPQAHPSRPRATDDHAHAHPSHTRATDDHAHAHPSHTRATDDHAHAHPSHT
ncbi:ATP-binding cassette domain-containing protein, partial [Couchioplanes caeruleus subsp. azureus]